MAEKILIIDDDPETIEFLTLILTRSGYRVLAARDGMEALTMAHAEKPDMVVLDIMMPGLDGYEVARSLRRHPDTALIPIMMFTAKTQVEDKLAGYEAGVDIYLTKPVHPVELQANIKNLLAPRKAVTEVLEKRGYVVGVLGVKGGLGASTVALNLALAYHQKQNARVIAAELRPGQGSWAAELDLANPVGLANLLRRSQIEITSSIIEQELMPTTFGVHLLLASSGTQDVDLVSGLAQYETIVEQLSVLAQLVVLDIGTNFHPAFDTFTRVCNEIVLITEPQPITIHRTRQLVDELKKRSYGSGKALTIVAVNRTHTEISLTVSKMEDMLKSSLALGIPPATELAYLAAIRNAPMVLLQPQGIIAQQFDILVKQVAGHATA
jgi:pilus assembly protein CpaE